MIIKLGQTEKRDWCFEDIVGGVLELELDGSYDVECMCCQLVERTGLPTRCYPKLIESRSGLKRGDVIV